MAGWGGVSAPADRICGPAEFPLLRVGLRVTYHPGHRDGLPGGRGCTAGHLNPGNISGDHCTYLWEGDNWTASKTGQDRPPRPNLDCGGELDGVLCEYEAPHCGAPQDGRLQVRQSFPPDEGGKGQDTTETREGGGDRPGRVPGPPHQSQTHNGWGGFSGQGRGFRCSPLPSMVRS